MTPRDNIVEAISAAKYAFRLASSYKHISQLDIIAEDTEVNVKMNPRDSMVFVSIKKLPEEQKAREEVLAELKASFSQDIGGKMLLKINPKHFDDAVKAGFNPAPAAKNIKFMEIKSADAAMDALANREDEKKQAEILATIKNLQTNANGYELIKLSKLKAQEEKIDKAFYEKLSAFKQKQAGFVNADKIANGSYSPRGEQLKAENELVNEFVVTKDNEIVANIMCAFHDDLVYIADFIVHSEQRNKHLAQALCYVAHQDAKENHPSTKGIWIISGGDGDKDVGKHLYQAIFPLKAFDETLQREQGLLTLFVPTPGPILLLSANRSLTAPHHTLDSQVQVRRESFLGSSGNPAAPATESVAPKP